MTSNTWIRAGFGGTNWVATQNTALIASLTTGQTLLRVRWAWGFGGYTSTAVSPSGIMTNPMAMGLVTTVGNGSETVPDPLSATGDAAPPTQRWLWWEQRVPTVVAWDPSAPVAIWQSSPPQEPVDARGQVLATGLGAGNTLNVWASYKGRNAWDASGQAQVWAYWSVLIRS